MDISETLNGETLNVEQPIEAPLIKRDASSS